MKFDSVCFLLQVYGSVLDQLDLIIHGFKGQSFGTFTRNTATNGSELNIDIQVLYRINSWFVFQNTL